MNLVIFQPDIPQNVGTMLRSAACLGVGVDIIEPCGFVFSDAKMRRAGMDYLDRVDLRRHVSWDAFVRERAFRPGRLLLLTTRGSSPYTEFSFLADDMIMVGRESSGVPDDVRAFADACLAIPMRPGLRSLNVAIAAAMVLGEALRQIGLPFDPPEPAISPLS